MRKIDKYHNVGTVPESNRKIVKRSKIDTSHIPSLGSGTIKRVGVKPVIKAKNHKCMLKTVYHFLIDWLLLLLHKKKSNISTLFMMRTSI